MWFLRWGNCGISFFRHNSSFGNKIKPTNGNILQSTLIFNLSVEQLLGSKAKMGKIDTNFFMLFLVDFYFVLNKILLDNHRFWLFTWSKVEVFEVKHKTQNNHICSRIDWHLLKIFLNLSKLKICDDLIKTGKKVGGKMLIYALGSKIEKAAETLVLHLDLIFMCLMVHFHK